MENEPPDLPPAPISIFRTRENFELFPLRVTTFEPLIRESLIKKKIEKKRPLHSWNLGAERFDVDGTRDMT